MQVLAYANEGLDTLLIDRDFFSKSGILKEFFSKRIVPYLLRAGKTTSFLQILTAVGVTHRRLELHIKKPLQNSL